MDKNEINLARELKRSLYLSTIIFIGWTILATVNLIWEMRHESESAIELARIEARSSLNKDLALLLWTNSHGGVYVPVSERTLPNPYLDHIPDRDILTSAGKKLTLMNPAFMLRQFLEESTALFRVKGKITSLEALNPKNTPDAWEKKALQAFAKGEKELQELSHINGEPSLRLMQPLHIIEGCLKCHAQQGYKTGELRGGVSVAVLMAPYYKIEKAAVRSLVYSHGLIWFLVSGAILVVTYLHRRRLRRFFFLQNTLAANQKQLRHEKQRLDEIIRGTNIGTWEWNIRTGKAQFNQRWAEIVGYLLEELEPISIDTWLRLVHPEDLQLSQNALDKHFSGELRHYECEARMRHKNGAWIWVLARGKVVEWTEEGKPLRMSGTHADITERKRAENTLQQQALVFENIYEGVIITDPCGKITGWSPSAERMFGYPAKQALGETPAILVRPEDSGTLTEEIMQGMKEKGRWQREIDFVHSDGSEVMCDTVFSPILDEQGELVAAVGVSHDITGRKLVEKALRENKEDLSASLQEKEVLLSEIHHRVKNNLQIISSLLQLQARGEDAAIVKALEESGRRVKVMARLHEKLYQSADFQHIDTHGFLCALVEDLKDGQLSQGQRISFVQNIEPIKLTIDRAILVGQIFSELLSNTLKHAFTNKENGEVTISLQRTTEGQVELMLADNGIGMPADFDYSNSKSLGWQLIQALSNKLKASLKVDRTKAPALSFCLMRLEDESGPYPDC